MKKIYSEPLLHFLLIALAFFFVYQFSKQENNDDKVIIVSEGRIDQLKNNFLKSNQRHPLDKEVDNVIQAFALNEMYLREARSLGLHQNDQVINRRLRQKMEYLLDDMAGTRAPSDEELKTFYANNQKRYLEAPKYTLSQVLISTDRADTELRKVVALQQNRIEQGQSPQGDIHLLPPTLVEQSPQQIERQFGKVFVEHITDLPLGEWAGPLSSSFGLHFVRLEKYSEAKVKPFERVKPEVLGDWRYENAQTFKNNFERELLSRYQIQHEVVPQGAKP
ncbi:PPIC-type PPIASE domain-containing protein [Alteromonadaceae bacterium Bs31]|nr:PPIC-type PPIASE domain-containing protein [Alteromonadaceae bacterium Bs31]